MTDPFVPISFSDQNLKPKTMSFDAILHLLSLLFTSDAHLAFTEAGEVIILHTIMNGLRMTAEKPQSPKS